MNKECKVCFEKKPTYEFYPPGEACEFNPKCYEACMDCKFEAVKSEFLNNYHHTSCPFCKKPMTDEEVRFYLEHGKCELNDATTLQRFVDLKDKFMLEKLPDFIWCAHNCGSGQINDGGEENVVVTCCFRHKLPFHCGMTCKQFDEKQQDLEMASETLKKQTSKPCPKCSAWVLKDPPESCDKMVCYCKYTFCYQCLADYDQIRKHGNHYHKSTCTFYAHYDEPKAK